MSLSKRRTQVSFQALLFTSQQLRNEVQTWMSSKAARRGIAMIDEPAFKKFTQVHFGVGIWNPHTTILISEPFDNNSTIFYLPRWEVRGLAFFENESKYQSGMESRCQQLTETQWEDLRIVISSIVTPKGYSLFMSFAEMKYFFRVRSQAGIPSRWLTPSAKLIVA